MFRYVKQFYTRTGTSGDYVYAKLGTTPNVYGPGRIWEKVSEYQLYYYNKYGK